MQDIDRHSIISDVSWRATEYSEFVISFPYFFNAEIECQKCKNVVLCFGDCVFQSNLNKEYAEASGLFGLDDVDRYEIFNSCEIVIKYRPHFFQPQLRIIDSELWYQCPYRVRTILDTISFNWWDNNACVLFNTRLLVEEILNKAEIKKSSNGKQLKLIDRINMVEKLNYQVFFTLLCLNQIANFGIHNWDLAENVSDDDMCELMALLERLLQLVYVQEIFDISDAARDLKGKLLSKR